MRERSHETVVVTGVSSGIGGGAAEVLVRAGFKVFGSVRRRRGRRRPESRVRRRLRAPDLRRHRRGRHRRRRGRGPRRPGRDPLAAWSTTPGPHRRAAALHAGGRFRQQIEINLVGPFLVTQAFAPLLGTDPALTGAPGRIVNISSVGGKMAAPSSAPTPSPSMAWRAYSESLRRELLLFGIDVIIIGPGAVVTPIWDKAEAAGIGPYAGTPYEAPMRAFSAWFLESGRRDGYPPARVAEVVLKALTTPKPKVRYAVVPKPLMNWIVPRILPKRMVDRTMGKATGLLPKS